jgi:hypothetical protein
MRNLVMSVVVVLACAACGPSSSDVSGAKTAHYHGDKTQLLQAAVQAAQAKYRVEKVDQNALSFQTTGRWYTPEGLAAAESGEDMRQVPDKSLSIAFVVTLRPDGDAYVVDIKSLMIRYMAGSPKPEPINEDDPSVPGWATGKKDALALDVHEGLKQWEVQTVPGNVPPAPANTPATSPAPMAPAPSPDGSAAPTPSPAS